MWWMLSGLKRYNWIVGTGDAYHDFHTERGDFMKITDNLGKTPGLIDTSTREERKAPDASTASFRQYARRAESQLLEERMAALVSEITEQGKKLGKKIDIRDLKAYKKLISDFLDEVVNSSHRFSKENFVDRRGRHRAYAIIKKINDELAVLTRDVLSDEKDNIRILQRIDDIRGLLLDILM